MNKYALVIIISFAGLIGAGTLLLMMPFSTVSGAITFENAFIVIIISFIIITCLHFALLTFQPGYRFFDLLFETVSAFGTVGLSLGVTSSLTSPAKAVMIVTMFIGRIGPLLDETMNHS